MLKAMILALLLAGCGGGGDDPGMIPPVQPPDCRGAPEVCR